MASEAPPRYDDPVRSERYFTATLLPMMLFHDEFRGLVRFVELVDERAAPDGGNMRLFDPRSGQGEVSGRPRAFRIPPDEGESVEVITEFHIARDLRFAHVPLSPATGLVTQDGAEPERRDAPDVVLVAGDQLIVCEAKFFGVVDPVKLKAQLRSQRLQVRHLFVERQFQPYRHMALLPFRLREKPDCTGVVTWGDIADLAEELLGAEHYVTRRLRKAVERRGDPTSDDPAGTYARKPVGWVAIAGMCQTEGNAIEVGFLGGEAVLVGRERVYLEQRPWRWRRRGNSGKVNPRNWIPGSAS
jgi:hypothetical protein